MNFQRNWKSLQVIMPNDRLKWWEVLLLAGAIALTLMGGA